MSKLDLSFEPRRFDTVYEFGNFVLECEDIDVQAYIAEAAECGQVEFEANQQVTARHERLVRRRCDLTAVKQQLVPAHEAASQTAFNEAFENDATSFPTMATQWSHRQDEIAFINGCLENLQRVALPQALLALLKSEWLLLRAVAVLQCWQAVQSGIERNRAASELLTVEGSVVYSVTGKTHEAFLAAQGALRRSVAAYNAYVDAEKQIGANV